MTATNWDQELKRIEREFHGMSPDPVIRLDSARAAAEKHAQERRRNRRAAIAVWARLALVVALAAAINAWPYPRACGAGLFAYMGAAGIAGTGAIWVAASSWTARLAGAHMLSMVVLIASLALLALEVAPRVGYAKVDGPAPAWRCAAVPAPPAASPSR